MNILDSLNSQQRQAVTTDGPVMIIAGPGTGKTKTLTAKVEYLITEKSIEPHNILALTFTKKAAAEMRERLAHLVHLPDITTFHGLAYDILSHDGARDILNDRERSDLLYEVFKQVKNREPKAREIRDLSLHITKYKNQTDLISDRFVQVYEDLKKKEHTYDYDDLLIDLKKNLEEKSLRKYSHILVDEFQDTNDLQYELIKRLISSSNIFVIGDPCQSIYGFRGGSGEIFNTFKKDFPEVVSIILQMNYRSGQLILDTSEALFSEKRGLIGDQQKKSTVTLITTYDEYTEADWIVRKIYELIGGIDLLQSSDLDNVDEKGVFSQIAVVYRTHAAKICLEKRFVESGIPYQVVGEQSTYEQPEIQFILDHLRYSLLPEKNIFVSILRSPVLNLSKKTKHLVVSYFKKEDSLVSDLVDYLKENHSVPLKDINMLYTIINEANKVIYEHKNLSLQEVIHICLTNKYLQQFIAKKKAAPQNINQFMSTTCRYKTVEELIKYIVYLSEHDFYDPHAERVTLMTMHAAKGLEFDDVFICGFEEGMIPMNRQDTEVEEEKRLFYVALTRAKKNIYLLYPEQRNKKKNTLSRFFLDIKSFIGQYTDPAIEKIKRKREKWIEKKSQMELF